MQPIPIPFPLLTLSLLPFVHSMVILRSSSSELCKASGSKCHDRFLTAVASWTAAEIDAMAVAKNPVHMAAWKGCVENLQYLVEVLSCDLNTISTGEFSYGKTPIFFALTQSREDIVRYLVDRKVHVKIVNNKGQTPLSIASSHLSREATLAVQALEQEQADTPWRNYRATHSDGLEYGDLDPRFLTRPIRPTDTVTEFAVNPTTAAIRKGNFRRNNPQHAKEVVPNKKRSKPKEQQQFGLSSNDARLLEETWSKWASLTGECNSTAERSELLLRIVQLNLKQRKEWLSSTAKRLQVGESKEELLRLLQSTISPNPKLSMLLQRIERYIRDPNDHSNERSEPPSRSKNRSESVTDPQWQAAFQLVRHLSADKLQSDGCSSLSLPTFPIWVDSVEGLKELSALLESVSLVSIDTEWSDGNVLSTLQIAVDDKACVVDLMKEQEPYKEACKRLILGLFQTKSFILGFAIAHDLTKLQDFVGRPLNGDSVLDVQRLFEKSSGDLPGLAWCVDQLPAIGLSLSKTMQCSEWGQRPLSNDQLAYAGLDAAILGFVLSEKGKMSA